MTVKVKVESKKTEEKEYSIWIGLYKSLKNVLVTVGVPAVVYLINNAVEWVPIDYQPILLPLVSVVAYMVKNKLQFSKG